MSYTPHTWTDGETITAAKMNNLEEGCSGGGGNPIMKIHINNFSSGTDLIGAIALCKLENGTYYAQQLFAHGEAVFDSNRITINVMDMGTADYYYPLEIPVPSGDLYLVFIEGFDFVYTFSGNIDPEQVTVNYGSTGHGHIITGDFTVNVDYS